MKLAEAYGARGVLADSPMALQSAIKEAIRIEAPTLIEVPMEETPSPF